MVLNMTSYFDLYSNYDVIMIYSLHCAGQGFEISAGSLVCE